MIKISEGLLLINANPVLCHLFGLRSHHNIIAILHWNCRIESTSNYHSQLG